MDLNVPECAMTNDCQVREVRAQYPPSRQDGQDGQDLEISPVTPATGIFKFNSIQFLINLYS